MYTQHKPYLLLKLNSSFKKIMLPLETRKNYKEKENEGLGRK